MVFGESLTKVEQKIVNTISWQSLSPVSQTPVFCKEFGLLVGNTSNKVSLVVLKQVGVLNKFVRWEVSISSEKWLSFSPLDPYTTIFKSPASKILSYLFITWLIAFDNSWKKTLSYLVAYKWI